MSKTFKCLRIVVIFIHHEWAPLVPYPDVLWTCSSLALLQKGGPRIQWLFGSGGGFWPLAVVGLGNVSDGMIASVPQGFIWTAILLNNFESLNWNLLFSCETNDRSKKNKDTPELGVYIRSGWSVTLCMSGLCLKCFVMAELTILVLTSQQRKRAQHNLLNLC